MNLFKRAADIFAKHDVPIENGDLPEGVMSETDYDADGAVKEAGGIAPYVEAHGSGLPDPSEYDDGTVLIKVDNEWKAQSGYGYESELAPIEWDGDTEGLDVLQNDFYKVTDDAPTLEESLGGTYTVTVNGTPLTMQIDSTTSVLIGAGYPAYYLTDDTSGVAAYVAAQDIYIDDTLYIKKGVWMLKHEEESSTILCTSICPNVAIQKIDPKFIPKIEDDFIINFTFRMDDTIVADKTMEEIESAMMAGKRPIGRAAGYYTDFIFMGDNFVNTMIDTEGNELMVIIIEPPEDGEIWTYSSKIYTLTPASQDTPPV